MRVSLSQKRKMKDLWQPLRLVKSWHDTASFSIEGLQYQLRQHTHHAPYLLEELPVECEGGDPGGVVSEPVVPPRLPEVAVEREGLRVLVDRTHRQDAQVDRHPGGGTSDLKF